MQSKLIIKLKSALCKKRKLSTVYRYQRRGQQQQKNRKGQDVVHTLYVTMEELYAGAVRKLALEKNVICSVCEGKSPWMSYMLEL